MKRIATCAALTMAALGILAVTMAADEAKKADQGCPMKAALKDAVFKAENVEKGVTLTVTGEKPELVKAIQTRFANFGKAMSCGDGKDTTDCKKGDAKGCGEAKDAACATKMEGGMSCPMMKDAPKTGDAKGHEGHNMGGMSGMGGMGGRMMGAAAAQPKDAAAPKTGACPMMSGHGAHVADWKKDAAIKVTNVDKGVSISVTAEKPETAKTIQTHFANFGKGMPGCSEAHTDTTHTPTPAPEHQGHH